MPLIATAGDPAANSYVSASEATALLQETLDHVAWDEAIDPVRVAALLMATRLLNQFVDWYGTPATRTQALPWPQTGQQDRWARAILGTVVPPDIKRATALYALALLQEAPAGDGASAADLEALDEFRMGDTALVFRKDRRPLLASAQVPRAIRALLKPYGDVVGSGTVWLLRA